MNGAALWVLDAGYWILDWILDGYWLDTGYWILETGYWILDTGWILDTNCSLFINYS
jgi:hypothetical protein